VHCPALIDSELLPGGGAFGRTGAAGKLFRRVHGFAAGGCSAVAGCLVVIAVVEVVVVGQFFSGGDVAYSFDPDATPNFAGLAVRVAGVVNEHRHAVPVDDPGAVTDAEEVGGGRVLVFLVSLLLGNAGAGVLDNAGAVFDGLSCVAAGRMNS